MIAFIGGILLIIGAYFTYQGQIFYSVLVYFIADIAWVLLAFESNNNIGAVMIIIGMLLGLGAWLKMNFGKMKKSLRKD